MTAVQPKSSQGGGTPAPRQRSLLADLWTADLVIGLAAAVIFGLALLETFQWSFRTALFPRVVTITGLVMALLFIAGFIRSTIKARSAAKAIKAEPAGTELLDEDDEHDQEIEYVYATATGKAWAEALGWVAGFVILLYVAGLFITAAAFSLCYLHFAAGRSWRFAAIYSVVMTGVLYVGLDVLLPVSVPNGLFF